LIAGGIGDGQEASSSLGHLAMYLRVLRLAEARDERAVDWERLSVTAESTERATRLVEGVAEPRREPGVRVIRPVGVAMEPQELVVS
jgi:hypothetical protein